MADPHRHRFGTLLRRTVRTFAKDVRQRRSMLFPQDPGPIKAELLALSQLVGYSTRVLARTLTVALADEMDKSRAKTQFMRDIEDAWDRGVTGEDDETPDGPAG